MTARVWSLALACVVASGGVHAQDDEAVAVETAEADAAGIESDIDAFDAPEDAADGWSFFGDARLRSERVSGLPNSRAPLSRTRLAARVGTRYAFNTGWSLGAAARIAGGTDDNRDNLRNNDNLRSDDVDLDQAWLRGRIGEHVELQLGKAPLPLVLTPLVWDEDLRPIGASLQGEHAIGLDRVAWSAGTFDIDHPLRHGPRLHAAQLGWHWREGAPWSASVIGAYLAFDALDDFASAGLARGNPAFAGRYRNDTRLVDLQLSVRHLAGASGVPIELRVDLLRNLDADAAQDAGRLAFTIGDAQRPGGWQVGYSVQRLQAASALAAVNGDDWWFHAGTRGHGLFVEHAFDGAWSTRAQAFHETRDGLDDATRRVMLDVIARW